MSICFEAELLKIGFRKIIKIPLSSSKELPSRGMVMIKGKMNDIHFQEPLEPDGKGSHWLEISDTLSKEAGVTVGQTIYFNIDPINEWNEPEMPEDIMMQSPMQDL